MLSSTRIVHHLLAALLLVGVAQVSVGSEIDAWKAADDCAGYRAFLADYPDGKLAPLAKRRLQDCPPENPPAPPQPVVQPPPDAQPWTPPAFAPSAQVTKDQARALVERLITVSNSTDLEAMVALFADPARYFGWGSSSHAAIRKDKRAYFRRWPRVHYELAAPLQIHRTVRGNLTVEMELSYEVYSPQRAKRVTGTTRNTLIIGLVGGSPKIKSIQETVLRRDRW